MGDDRLYVFWLIVTALFVFSFVYSWIIAVIVRKALPGELAWVFLGLAFITGCKAFIRSGEQLIEPRTVMVISRAMYMMVGISSCVAVVMLGKGYNGAVSSRLPLREQVELLKQAFQSEQEEVSNEE